MANETKTEIVQEELNLDTKVTVKSIAGWMTGFARKTDNGGDVGIQAGGSVRLTRNEIIAQVQNGNVLFTGIDGKGSHATLYIEDEATRKEVDFEDGDRKQTAFATLNVKELFSIKSQSRFEEEFSSAIRTRAEKYAVMETIRKLGINDYAKIKFAENHTGYRYQ